MYENDIRSARKRYSGVTMINLRKPIVRFEKDSLYRVTKEPDTYLKIENRVYYFYTRLNNYLNYNMHMRYLIVTKQGWYKVVNGEMFDIKRKQKIITLSDNDDEIVAIEPLYSNLFYVVTTHNKILLVDIEFKPMNLRTTRESSGKKNLVKLSNGEEIKLVLNRFYEQELNSLLIINDRGEIKVIDDAPHRRKGNLPKPISKDIPIKLIVPLNKLNNSIIGIDNYIYLLNEYDFKDYVKKYNGMFKKYPKFKGKVFTNYELVKGITY